MDQPPPLDLVSVVVPCFNHGRFLPEALRSVQAQTYNHWEILVIDDGSTDDTRDVARRFAAADARISYVAQRNRGSSSARNHGLRRARGRFIQFLDADDVIKPEKFERQLRALASGHAGRAAAVAFCDFHFAPEHDTNERQEFPGYGKPRFRTARVLEDFAARWESGLSIPIHCFLFEVSLFHSAGISFDEALPTHDDWNCWMTLFAQNPAIVHVPEELAVYRRHENAKTQNLHLMRKGFLMAIDRHIAGYAHDRALHALLVKKRGEVAAAYAEQLRRRRQAWFRAHTPWKLQRIVGWMLDPAK